MAEDSFKKTALVTLASLFIPGLGQFMLKKPLLGAIYLGAAFAMWLIYLGWVVHIVAAVDAAARTRMGNRVGTSPQDRSASG